MTEEVFVRRGERTVTRPEALQIDQRRAKEYLLLNQSPGTAASSLVANSNIVVGMKSFGKEIFRAHTQAKIAKKKFETLKTRVKKIQ
jgi:hypothetical protein